MSQQTSKAFLYWFILGIVIFFYGFESLLRSIPNAFAHANLKYGSHSGTPSDLANIITGNIKSYYYYSYVPLQLIAGPMVDRYGVRSVLLISTLLLFIGVAFSGFATPDQTYLIYAGRFLIGAGSAFAFVCVITTATHLVPNDINFASGLSSGVGLLFSSYVGLQLMEVLSSIQSFFVLALAISALILILIFCFVRIPQLPEQEIQTWSAIIKGYLQLFKSLNLWLIGIIGAVLFLPIILFTEYGNTLIPNLFMFTGSESEMKSFITLIATTLSVGFIVGSPLVGWMSKSPHKSRILLTFGSLASCIIVSFLTFHFVSGTFLQAFMVFVLGLCISVEILVFPLASSTVSRGLTGSAVACVNFFVMIPGMLGKFIQTRVGDDSFILILPIFLLIVFLLSFFIKLKQDENNVTTS